MIQIKYNFWTFLSTLSRTVVSSDSKFRWHVEELGMIHVHIKRASPRLNDKVECSHLTDQQEFYQLLKYKNDVDLKAKLKEWGKHLSKF